MDVVLFRQFLKSKVYATKEDLSDALGKDKGVDEFYQWVLDLRDDYRGRKYIGDHIQQRERCTVNTLPDFWYRAAEQECFDIWSVLHKRCRPCTKRPTNVHPKSCKQHRCLSHMGRCSYHVPSFAVQAQTVCTILCNALWETQIVLWLDIFYRHNFRPARKLEPVC